MWHNKKHFFLPFKSKISGIFPLDKTEAILFTQVVGKRDLLWMLKPWMLFSLNVSSGIQMMGYYLLQSSNAWRPSCCSLGEFIAATEAQFPCPTCSTVSNTLDGASDHLPLLLPCPHRDKSPPGFQTVSGSVGRLVS